MRLHFLPLLLTAVAAITTATPLLEPPKHPKQHPKQVFTPETKIDLSGLPIKMAECYARYRPTTTQAQWCTMSIAEIHAWCQKTWFNCVCKHPADKHHVWPRQEMEAYITAFNGWMDAMCGFHTITNTGMPLLDMCGVF